jgi:hypothetical protein
VGLGGFITSKGWIELGNPASVKISLKLFNINNCSARASSVRASASDPLEFAEVRDLGEFKLALRALRTAAQFVCPWNMSFLALEGFLIQTDYAGLPVDGRAGRVLGVLSWGQAQSPAAPRSGPGSGSSRRNQDYGWQL